MHNFEFNPKERYLDQQLKESGLEMTITAAGAGALFDIGSSLVGGILGFTQANAANAQAESDYRVQKLKAELDAEVQNKMNQAQFTVNKLNYEQTRRYEYANALRQWQYNQSIQDFEYLSAVKEYGKSVTNTANQLTYNNIAEQEAVAAEQAALNEIYDSYAFEQQGSLVDQLKAQGKAALGQAGNVRQKTLQSAIADSGRNSAIMDANLSSAVVQSQRNLRSIGFQKYQADLAANANMMIQPQKGPALAKPMETPEALFMAPIPVNAQAVARPVMQNAFAPLLGGITGAAKTAVGFDWSKFSTIGGKQATAFIDKKSGG